MTMNKRHITTTDSEGPPVKLPANASNFAINNNGKTFCKLCGKTFKTPLNEVNQNYHTQSEKCKKLRPTPKAKNILSFFSPETVQSDANDGNSKTKLGLPNASAIKSVVGNSGIDSNAVIEDTRGPMIDLDIVIVDDGTQEPNEENTCPNKEELCNGYRPDIGGDFFENYPFQLHASTSPVQLDFKVVGHALHWLDCGLSTGSSKLCAELKENHFIKSIEKRAKIPSDHTPFRYLTPKQLIDKAHIYVDRSRKLDLEKLNLVRDKAKLKNSLTMHKRFVIAIAENNVPRISQLVKVCMTQRRSISFIIQRISDAVGGIYHARGYTDQDTELGWIVCWIGGARLVKVLQNFGLPCLSTIKARSKIMELQFDLQCCTDQKLSEMLNHNLSQILEHGSLASIWSLKVDEVKVQKRLRWCEKDNKVYGLCYEHGHTADIEFRSLGDAERIMSGIRDGTYHIATECLVFVMTRIGDAPEYVTYPLLNIPICSHSDYDTQLTVFKLVEQLFKKFNRKSPCGKLLNVGTDGDSVRRRVLHCWTSAEQHSSAREVADIASLDLFDGIGSPSLITVNRDPKHVSKRLRNRATTSGYAIGPVTFNKALLSRIIGAFDSQKKGLLTPSDKQNVAMAYQLLHVLGRISHRHPDEFPPALQPFVLEFKILGAILESVTALYARYKDDLQDMLTELSFLAHLLLFVYRKNGNDFIPSQLYYDLQSTIIDVFVTVNKLQVWCPEKKLFLYQLGSDECEIIFSIVRTITHDRNCDVLQLKERLQHSATLMDIYARHPEWKKTARRLNIDDAVDHTGTAHWTGELRTGLVDLKQSWCDGKAKCEVLLIDCKWTEGFRDLDKSVTIMKPKGVYVGVTEIATDDSVLEQWLEENDDEEELLENDFMAEFEELVPAESSTERYVEVENKPVHKASVLRSACDNGYQLSSDRLRRVRGLSKSPYDSEDAVDENQSIMVGDPCVTLLNNKKCGFHGQCLAVIIIEGLENRKNAMITCPSSVTGKIISLVSDDDFMTWKRDELSKKSIKTSLFDPIDVSYDLLTSSYKFSKKTLKEAYNILNIRSAGEPIEDSDSEFLPYPMAEAHTEFEADINIGTDRWCCDKCGRLVFKKQFRQHVGGHILRGDIDTLVCGFCGTNDGCHSRIERTSGSGATKTVGVSSNCKRFVKFSLKAVSKSTRSGPCTNRIVSCQAGNCNSVSFWSYAAPQHYATFHKDETIPEEWRVTQEEKKMVCAKF